VARARDGARAPALRELRHDDVQPKAAERSRRIDGRGIEASCTHRREAPRERAG